MDTLVAFVIAAVITILFVHSYLKGLKKKEALAHQAAEKGKLYSHGPSPSIPILTPPIASVVGVVRRSVPRVTCLPC